MSITPIKHYAMLTGEGVSIVAAIQSLEVKINEHFKEGYTMYDDRQHITTTVFNGSGAQVPYHCFLQVMVKRDLGHEPGWTHGRLVGGGPVANRLEPDSFGGPVEELRDRILSRRD